MRLGLSSAAAPDATLDELLAACQRRGLVALELGDEDGHGVVGGIDGVSGTGARLRAEAVGIVISGFRSDTVGADLRLGRIADSARAPVLVGGDGAVSSRLDRARGLAAVGADVAVVVRGTAPEDDIERIVSAGVTVAWDAVPEEDGMGRVAGRVLDTAGVLLRHVRVLGGGPEAAMQEGRGVGELMARLALAGYRGTVVVAPSSSRYRVAWRNWLGRGAGGWGCGSRTADPSLVRFEESVSGAGGGR